MAVPRRRGFTLIELLVVIAIIGILAAMLFPVFARARESARKVQCLSNIKNIAMAMQMYLSDYDMFPPHEHDAAVAAFFDTSPRGWCTPLPSNRVDGTNPFLRWPVILDEYIKNREVWHCPSAKIESGPTGILPQDWTGAMRRAGWEVVGSGGLGLVCGMNVFPTGWGGDITDSTIQTDVRNANLGGQRHGFVESIGTGAYIEKETKPSSIEDVSNLVVCADSSLPEYWNQGLVVFPDNCYTVCGSEDNGCCNSGTDDSVGNLPASLKHRLYTDGSVMGAHTRHMGGSNLGFADGHAKWMAAGAILAASRWHSWGPNGQLSGGDDKLKFTTTPTGVWFGCLCEFGA